jgi:DNA mismatch endonuclease (patch repair protein)
MRAVRRSGTAAELALRAEVDRLGLKYRVDEQVAGTRARADLLFEDAAIVVLMDGCFWHSCPSHSTSAKANSDWWRRKLENNRRRDMSADEQLHNLGWIVLRFWEHDDPKLAAQRITEIVAERVSTIPAREMAAPGLGSRVAND